MNAEIHREPWQVRDGNFGFIELIHELLPDNVG